MRYLWMVLLLLVSHVHADEVALNALNARLSGIASLRADFQQTLLSTEGRVLEQSSGELLLLQPGYFRWHILEPDEQLLIAEQGTLWHYDVDLETITRRNVPTDNSHTPLAVLGGSGDALGEQYQVEAAGAQAWRLVPRSENADFTSLVLEFDGDKPLLMLVEDPLLRNTEIRFVNTELNPPLTADDFSFEPPPGVDVYVND
jgi:outer membrane lipoprotein carrier protein